jgi:hypothetical protein
VSYKLEKIKKVSLFSQHLQLLINFIFLVAFGNKSTSMGDGGR